MPYSVLVITNPSAQAFKEHLGRTSYQGLVREHNYLLFSTYRDVHTKVRYRGLLENFFEEPEIVQPVVDSAVRENKKYDYSSFDKAVTAK